MDKVEKFWDRASGSFTNKKQPVSINNNKDYITTMKYIDIDDTVLDYGCATGLLSNAIADKVKEIRAVDISSRMIEMARETALERNIQNVHYDQATIYDDSLKEESFDAVLAFRILHVLEDPDKVVRRINALLKPGGVFISVTTCMGNLKLLWGPIVFVLQKARLLPLNINLFKLPELQELISSGVFEILEVEKMDDRIPCYCVVARKI